MRVASVLEEGRGNDRRRLRHRSGHQSSSERALINAAREPEAEACIRLKQTSRSLLNNAKVSARKEVRAKELVRDALKGEGIFVAAAAELPESRLRAKI